MLRPGFVLHAGPECAVQHMAVGWVRVAYKLAA